MVRAKFWIQSVTVFDSGQRSVVMYPVYNNGEENKRFWEATPSGRIELQLTKEDVAEFFVPGDTYFVDFTHVVKEEE